MKKYLFILLCLVAKFSMAQDVEFETKKYNWSDSVIRYNPLKTDTAFSSIYLLDKSVIEYSMPGDTLKRYAVSHTIKYLNDDKAVEDNNKIYLTLFESSN